MSFQGVTDPVAIEAMAAIDPDCRDGKHRACIGASWDENFDHIVDCECDCHADVEIRRHDA